ncbi:MAG: DUF166 family protein [Planctomycetota bacterium]
MRVLILRSVPGGGPAGPFTVRMDTACAERVLRHLQGGEDACSACGRRCVQCRARYDLDRSGAIAGVIDFPAVQPAVVEEPEACLPAAAPAHDILLAIAVQEQILAAWAARFPARGIIVPREHGDWISPHGMQTLADIARRQGAEVAFPRPFCNFAPAGGVLAAFQSAFGIGRPAVAAAVADGRITHATVRCSAPCGATYYVARHLEGAAVDRELPYRADMLLSAYPCTASHAVERDLGDSIIHEAVKVQRRALAGLLAGAPGPGGTRPVVEV